MLLTGVRALSRKAVIDGFFPATCIPADTIRFLDVPARKLPVVAVITRTPDSPIGEALLPSTSAACYLLAGCSLIAPLAAVGAVVHVSLYGFIIRNQLCLFVDPG